MTCFLPVASTAARKLGTIEAALLERMAVVPWTDAEGTKGFLVFYRDPAARERHGGLRCRPRRLPEELLAEELSRMLEAVQAGGGAAAGSPM